MRIPTLARTLGLFGFLATVSPAAPTITVPTPLDEALQFDAAKPTSVTIDLGDEFQRILLPQDIEDSRAATERLLFGGRPLPRDRGNEWLQRLRPLLRVIAATPTGAELVQAFVPRVREGKVHVLSFSDHSRGILLQRPFMTDIRSLFAAVENEAYVFLETESTNGVLLYHLAYAIQLDADPVFQRHRMTLQLAQTLGLDIQRRFQEMTFMSTRRGYDAAHAVAAALGTLAPEATTFLKSAQSPGGIDYTEPVPDDYILQAKGIPPEVAADCRVRMME